MQKIQEEILTDTARLRKVGNSLVLTVPAPIVEALEWRAGMLLVFHVGQNVVTIRPIQTDVYREG